MNSPVVLKTFKGASSKAFANGRSTSISADIRSAPALDPDTALPEPQLDAAKWHAVNQRAKQKGKSPFQTDTLCMLYETEHVCMNCSGNKGAPTNRGAMHGMRIETAQPLSVLTLMSTVTRDSPVTLLFRWRTP